MDIYYLLALLALLAFIDNDFKPFWRKQKRKEQEKDKSPKQPETEAKRE